MVVALGERIFPSPFPCQVQSLRFLFHLPLCFLESHKVFKVLFVCLFGGGAGFLKFVYLSGFFLKKINIIKRNLSFSVRVNTFLSIISLIWVLTVFINDTVRQKLYLFIYSFICCGFLHCYGQNRSSNLQHKKDEGSEKICPIRFSRHPDW